MIHSLSIFLGGYLVFLLFDYIFWIDNYIFIYSCYQKKLIQQEYCEYLNNLEEAVISKSSEGIRYFNLKGFHLLKTSLIKLENEQTKNRLKTYLDAISKQLKDQH